MNEVETFYKDREEYGGKLSYIIKENPAPKLDGLNELYGFASRLSAQNRERHRKVILSLAITGTLLTLFFLIYDGMGIHCMILACIIALIFLYLIIKWSNKLNCHKKYLDYRILAEAIRVQFFLSISAIETPVTELLPWFAEKWVDWIGEVIGTQPVLAKNEKIPILDFWIKNQIEYHANAAEKERRKLKKDKFISRIALSTTVVTFFILLIFEIWVFYASGEINNEFLFVILNGLQSNGLMQGCDQTELLRTFLKIIIGTMSATTLFISSYYGKMSLSASIDDHGRMKELYESTAKKMEPGETDELIIDLAREFLIENVVWYAYQKQNTADFVL